MSLLLPQNPEIRELVDVRSLAERQWITLPEAKAAARRQFSRDDGIRAIFFNVIRATGEIHLMRFGPRGGKQTVWNFGDPLKAA